MTGCANIGLTQCQVQLLRIIAAHVDQHGVAPSYAEMRRLSGLRSKSGVHRLVLALQERGYLTRCAGMARSIALRGGPDISITVGSGGLVIETSGRVTADWLRRHGAAIRQALGARFNGIAAGEERGRDA